MDKTILSAIVGNVPDGATSFHTSRGKIVFLIGKIGHFVERPLTDGAVQLLRAHGVLGGWGWEVQA